ncbi:hypothetical protein BV898_19107 [Hypsibius exemplaris]|uniref:Uncharacterized protein n=1 Tax=Hypsibius exemplaris TaxID=2072580 RepID=A0A9X6NL19_HYPEX|nr:hypothetical protein BV898_19107 [Hypsibius exemplaris]
MLPIEEIRIDSKVRSDEYHIANEWTSYANQPSTFTFRITCSNNETCIEIAENIRQHPNAFTSSLEVFYSLQTQRTEKRSVLVKLEHMRSAELFAKLQLEFPDEDHVYLLMADWKKIQLEVSTTVLDTEMTDDDFFVSSDEAANIGRHLDRVLRVKHVGSGTFTLDMWSRVFWTAETARPDVTIKILNDIYDKNDRHLQEALKRALRTSNNSERSGAVLSSRPSTSSESAILFEDLQTIWNSLKASGSWGLVCPDKKNSHAGPMSVNEKRSRLKSLLMDARQVSTWNGEEFVVKPIQLTKISLAAFRGVTTSTTVIVNIQMKVARTTSELRTRINVPKKSAIEGVMPGQVEFVKQFSRFEPFARNEISKVSEMLREIKANLSGSEALVQHMFAVLSAADSSNGGQVANYSVTIQVVLERTDGPLSDTLLGLTGNITRATDRLTLLESSARRKYTNISDEKALMDIFKVVTPDERDADVRRNRGGFLVFAQGPSLWKLPGEYIGETRELSNIFGEGNRAVTVDCVNHHLYWANPETGIRRSRYDGSDNHLVVTKVGIYRGLAVDFVSRNVFWVEGSTIL